MGSQVDSLSEHLPKICSAVLPGYLARKVARFWEGFEAALPALANEFS